MVDAREHHISHSTGFHLVLKYQIDEEMLVSYEGLETLVTLSSPKDDSTYIWVVIKLHCLSFHVLRFTLYGQTISHTNSKSPDYNYYWNHILKKKTDQNVKQA